MSTAVGKMCRLGKGEKAAGCAVAADKPRGRASLREPISLRRRLPFGSPTIKKVGRIVAQVFDMESATVVKQLPSEEVVAFLRKFHKAVALLVDKTV